MRSVRWIASALVLVVAGVLEQECGQLLRDFFDPLRDEQVR